jgi:hypothetical protein
VRVHPAQPSYSVVVPAPELLSVNVAVKGYISRTGRFRKWASAYCGTSLTTGPLLAGGAATDCAGCSAF